MKPKRCNVCNWHWFNSSQACPNCGEARLNRREAHAQINPHVKNTLWVAGAVTLLILIFEMT